MRSHVASMLSILIGVMACDPGGTPDVSAADLCQGDAAEVFGPTDVAIESVDDRDVDPLNADIASAVADGAGWADSPGEILAHFVAESPETPGTLEEEEVGASARIVTYTETGWADDSVAGQRHRLCFKAEDDAWVVTRALSANECRRPDRSYRSEACP